VQVRATSALEDPNGSEPFMQVCGPAALLLRTATIGLNQGRRAREPPWEGSEGL
jgi:hypothetical protein